MLYLFAKQRKTQAQNHVLSRDEEANTHLYPFCPYPSVNLCTLVFKVFAYPIMFCTLFVLVNLTLFVYIVGVVGEGCGEGCGE